MNKTILITGATGFLGSHITWTLFNEGFSIIILKRSFSDIWRIREIIDKIRYYDIDKVELEIPFKENEIDCIIHTATNYGKKREKISEIIETNVVFPLKLLEIATFFNTDTFLIPILFLIPIQSFIDILTIILCLKNNLWNG